MGGMVVTPVPMGKVGRLVGKRLRADVSPGDEPGFVVGLDIELGVRADPDSPAWASPLWRFSSRTTPAPTGDASPVRPKAPRFATLSGRPTEPDMRVGEQRPRVLLRVDEPVASYDWELMNDLVKVDGATGVTTGVSDDGRWISFRPAVRLRRSGHTRKVKLGDGVFRAPFEPPRDRAIRTRRYKGITYPRHSVESIDFNRGSGETDRGDPVYAAAKGTVVDIKPENGAVFISHPGGWITVYGHMDPIENDVVVGATVEPTTLLGRIGDKYLDPDDPTATISPHLHHQQIRDGIPRPVRFDRREYVLNAPITGWRRPSGRSDAVVRVRVSRRSDGTASPFRKLRIVVAKEPDGRSDIDRPFDGEEVAPGEYSARYRVEDSHGQLSEWAFDHSIVVRRGRPL